MAELDFYQAAHSYLRLRALFFQNLYLPKPIDVSGKY
jgi:hypothetical protein